MLHHRALLGLLVVATIAAATAVWLLGGTTEPPPTPNPDGVTKNGNPAPIATGDTGVVHAATAATAAGPAEIQDQSAVRVEVGPSRGTDDRPCRLEVEVVSESAGRSIALPFTEVGAALSNVTQTAAIARTDARGIAEYTFIGGDGHAVQCLAGVGGQRSVTLQADATVRATIRVQPKLFASGRVIDQSNVGIADADLVLLRWPDDSHSVGQHGVGQHSVGALWRIGRSGRDGSFHLPIGVGGQIGASHANYVSSPIFMVRPNRNPALPTPTQVFELILQQESATIAGTVRDPDGQPIANARVELRSVRRAPVGAERIGPPARATSDRNGSFRITGLPAGDARWFAIASDYGFREDVLTLHTNGDNRLDIELPLAAAVQGIVVSKATGRPIAGATIRAGKPGTLCHRTTLSGRDGTFLLDGLGPGTVPVRAEHQDLVATARLTLTPDYVTEWRAEILVDESSQVLRGKVVDANLRGLAGWKVIVRQGGLDPTGMTSGDDGTFAIPVVQAEGLDVRCYAPHRAPTSFADARVASASIANDVVLKTGRTQRVTIVGRVLGGDANGVPATIGCWHHQNREYARHSADSDGRFSITDVPVGTVNLTIEHPEHVTHESGNLNLRPAVPVDVGTVQLGLGGGLYGTVLAPSGIAPTDCVVSLRIDQPRRHMTAEYVDGSYRFSQVPPGKHTLQVQGDALGAASFPVKIQAGVDLPRDIELQAGIFRGIRVRVPAGAGNRVTLAISVPGQPPRWVTSSVVQRERPGAPGFALFETWMVPGNYSIKAVTPQGYEGSATIRYTRDGEAPFVLQLERR